MIDPSPQNLYRQIRGAIQHRDTRIAKLPEVRKAFHGPAYEAGAAKYDPENFAYELTSWMIPQMVYDNPKIRARSSRGAPQHETAQALGAAMNRWVRDTRLRESLLPLATDMMLCWGVAMVTEEETNRSIPPSTWKALNSNNDPISEAQPLWPVMSRIPPHRFFMDPAEEMPRFMGHVWIRDKEDLLTLAKDDSTWRVDAIEHLATQEGLDDLNRKGKEIPNRGEIMAYEVWIPEIELDTFPGEDGTPSQDDGYNGTIYTLSVRESASGGNKSLEADMIRDPRPFYGPRWGPYAMFGIHDVPDDPYPLSTVMAVKTQADELNRMGQSMTRSAESYKRLGLFNTKDAAAAKAIKDAEHQSLLGIEGFDPKSVIQDVEVGGLTEQQILWRNDRRDLLDRVSGFTDMQRGATGAGSTATEATIADSNSAIRTNFIQTQFRNAVEKVLRTVAWYMYHDDQIVFPLSPEDLPDGNYAPGEEVWYQGGDHDPESGATYDDLELEIEAYSMQRTNEGIRQRRMTEFVQTLVGMFPWMAQVPNAPWADLWSIYGESNNMPEARELGQKFANALAGAMPPMESSAGPRTASDVGAAGSGPPPMQMPTEGLPGNFSGNEGGGL